MNGTSVAILRSGNSRDAECNARVLKKDFSNCLSINAWVIFSCHSLSAHASLIHSDVGAHAFAPFYMIIALGDWT